MIISLVRMPPEGLRFQHQYQPGELDIADREFRFLEYPNVEGRVDRAGVDMRVRGTVKAGISAACDRCLNEVVLPVDTPFDLVYTSVEFGRDAGEVELHASDLDYARYENDEIDMDGLVLEQIELNLPIRVLCREDCRGLCPQCGTDLNQNQCACEPPIDPRWNVLNRKSEEEQAQEENK